VTLRHLVPIALALDLGVTIAGGFGIALAAPRAPPRPLTSVSLIRAHQGNLARETNRVHIEPLNGRLDQFRIRQLGHPDVMAGDFNSVLRTLSERQKSLAHEALQISPDFEDKKQLDIFSARLKVKRPFYFAYGDRSSLRQAGIDATRRAYETDPIKSIAPAGEMLQLSDGHWAQDMAVTRYGADVAAPESLTSWTVRVLSTLKDLVLDVRNYLIWAHQAIWYERRSPPTVKDVVERALTQLAANSNIGPSALRSLVSVQLNQVDVAGDAIAIDGALLTGLPTLNADDSR
jgi:hypothetical protein